MADYNSRRSCIDVERLEPRALFSSSYTVVDLGAQAGVSLNNHGQALVEGATMSASSVYQNGQLIPLSTYAPKLAKHRKALPLFIDDAGEIVGTFYAGHTARVPAGPNSFGTVKVAITDVFLFDGKHFKDIGVGTPLAVAGQSVIAGTTNGDYSTSSPYVGSGSAGSGNAFLYFHGRRKIISVNDSAISVNASGDCLLDSGNRIYIAATHTITTLGQTNLVGAQINDSDQVAGHLEGTFVFPTGTPQTACFVSSSGQITQLGTLGGANSAAVAINDSGAIVGTSMIAGGSSVFLDVNGSMEDLNSLAPPSNTGWTLMGVTSINNAGQILASGVSAPGGATHQLLLSPIG